MLSDTEYDDALERYYSHVRAIETDMTHRVYHIAVCRGLYRLLVDTECAGGPAAPMGMPHTLCITDHEMQQMAQRGWSEPTCDTL